MDENYSPSSADFFEAPLPFQFAQVVLFPRVNSDGDGDIQEEAGDHQACRRLHFPGMARCESSGNQLREE